MLAVNEKAIPVVPEQIVTGASSTLLPSASKTGSLHLKELWQRLMRQKLLFLLTLLTTLGLAALLTWMMTPQFRAVSTIQIEKQGAQIVDFGEINQQQPDMGELDPFFRTQYEQLKSRKLAERVIEKLNLKSRLFNKNFDSDVKTRVLGQLKYMFSPVQELSKRWLPIDLFAKENTPDYPEEFLKRLFIEPVEKTHLVKVFFESPDPEISAEVTNTLVNTFIRETLTEESQSDTYAQTFLNMELEKARKRLTDSEEELVTFARENEILEVNNSQTTQEQKLTTLNSALVTAEQRRIEADNQLQQARQHGSVGGILRNPVIESLKRQLADLEADYQNKSQVFKPAYPDMQQLTNEISTVKQKLAAEQATLAKSLEAEQTAAQDQEDKLREEIDEYREELIDLRDRSVEYNTLQREVDTNRKLYDELSQRLKEVSVASGASSSNVRVIDTAKAPLESFRPNKPLNLLIGLVTGLMLAGGLALLRESLSEKLHSTDELQALSGLPVLGTIPYAKRFQRNNLALAASREVGSPIAEAYRVAATHLKFATPQHSVKPQIYLLTSVNPSEGKSTSSVNIALSKAQMGNKVLLIDADLRRPSIHEKMELGNQLGLSEYLYGDIELSKATQHFQEIRNTYVITSGQLNLDPVEAIASERMVKLLEMARKYFDVTIVDAPPVTGFADALLLAGMADATMVVTHEDHIERKPMAKALLELQRIKQNVIGFLVVKAKQSVVGEDYYERYRPRSTASDPALESVAANKKGLNLAK